MHEQRSENDGVDRLHEEGSKPSDYSSRFSSDGMVVQNEDELLPIHVAAHRAGISRAALLSWIRNGFIEAQTSKQGWVVRAGDVEPAQRSADDARMGMQYSLESRLNPRVHEADRERVVETTSALAPDTRSPQASDHQIGNTLFAPLAEFVRDQADVVQEQAETIGWLQAELRRAREQLEERESEQVSTDVSEDEAQSESKPEVAAASGDGSVIDGLRAQFAQSEPGLNAAQPEDDHSMLFSVIEQDPFSDEAARARMVIEESERRISGLWDEHEELRMRHTAEPARSTEEQSWLKWLTMPWKRHDS